MRSSYRMLLVAAVLIVALVASMSLVACGADDTSTTPPVTGTDSGPGDAAGDDPAVSLDGRELVNVKCSMCHPLGQVQAAQYDRAGWIDTVDRMKRNGLVITDEEYEAIIDFLAEE